MKALELLELRRSRRKYIKKEIPCKPCKVCNKEFQPRTPQHIYCSKLCVAKHADTIQIRSMSKETKLPSGTVGAISEILVSADLMKKGWDVYRALSPSSYCDLIAIKNDTILKLEVRTGTYYTRKNTGLTLSYPPKKIAGKTVVVYTYSDNKIHYIGAEL